MKLKLKNNPNLVLNSIQGASNIESLYITVCPKVNSYAISKSIVGASGNKLTKIRLDRLNVNDSYSELMKYSTLKGMNDDGTEAPKPYLSGTWTLTDWILQSERDTIDSSFGPELTVRNLGIATDFEYSGDQCIHFTSSSVPDISHKTFDLADFDRIYIGDGSSHYNDEAAISLYKAAWPEYSSKMMTWFSYLIETTLSQYYTYVPYILSDRVAYLDPSYTIGDDTELLVDASFVLKPTGDYVLYGSTESGFKGTSDGLYYYLGTQANPYPVQLESGDSYLESDTEAVYIASAAGVSKNGITIYPGGTRKPLGGGIKLFGDSGSKFMGKIYYLQISEGDTVVRNYIPVYENATDLPGLYDTVTGDFISSSHYWYPGATRYLVSEGLDLIITEDGNDNIII